jgi:ABC-type Zn uptake system ZnuABC Zn-binding protein ZnuA
MMRAAGAKVILMEEYHSNAATDQVASRTGAHILRLPGGTRFQQGQTYLQFMEGVVAQLEAELRRAG